MNRRGFFKLLAGVAASPILKPLEKSLKNFFPNRTTYIVGENAVIAPKISYTVGDHISYNVRFTISLRPGTTMRIRNISQ